MAVWMFPMPCACAGLSRRMSGSGRWWPNRRWAFPSSRMSCQKTSEARVMPGSRALCPDGIHSLPAAALCDTRCQSQYCTASTSTGSGCGSATTPGELAEERRRFGVQRLHFLFQREGLVVDPKRTERLYREEHLSLHLRPQGNVPVPCGRACRHLSVLTSNGAWILSVIV